MSGQWFESPKTVDTGSETQRVLDAFSKLSPDQKQKFDDCYRKASADWKFNKPNLQAANQCIKEAAGWWSNSSLTKERARDSQRFAAETVAKAPAWTTQKEFYAKKPQVASWSVKPGPDPLDTKQVVPSWAPTRGEDPFTPKESDHSPSKANLTPEPLRNRDQMKWAGDWWYTTSWQLKNPRFDKDGFVTGSDDDVPEDGAAFSGWGWWAWPMNPDSF